MRCSDARRKLSALLDRAGEPELRRQVAKHVGDCGGCRAELEALASVDRSLGEALHGEPPAALLDGFWPRLAARLGDEEARPELDDMKALAAQHLVRAADRSAPAEDDLLHAPAALGQVVLPVPAAPPRRRRWPLVAGVLATVAAGVVVFVTSRPTPEPAVERVPLTPPPSPAAVAPPASPAPPSPAPPPPAVTPAAPPSPEPPPTTSPAKEAPAPKRPTASRPAEPAPAAAGASAPPPPPPPPKPEKTADEILETFSKPAEPAAPTRTVGNEKLTHEQIKSGMSTVAAAVQRCYDEHKVAGLALVNVKIDAQGEVVSVSGAGGFKGTPTGACVARAVEGARFDAFDGPPMNIKYSFKLEELE